MSVTFNHDGKTVSEVLGLTEDEIMEHLNSEDKPTDVAIVASLFVNLEVLQDELSFTSFVLNYLKDDTEEDITTTSRLVEYLYNHIEKDKLEDFASRVFRLASIKSSVCDNKEQ